MSCTAWAHNIPSFLVGLFKSWFRSSKVTWMCKKKHYFYTQQANRSLKSLILKHSWLYLKFNLLYLTIMTISLKFLASFFFTRLCLWKCIYAPTCTGYGFLEIFCLIIWSGLVKKIYSYMSLKMITSMTVGAQYRVIPWHFIHSCLKELFKMWTHSFLKQKKSA